MSLYQSLPGVDRRRINSSHPGIQGLRINQRLITGAVRLLSCPMVIWTAWNRTLCLVLNLYLCSHAHPAWAHSCGVLPLSCWGAAVSERSCKLTFLVSLPARAANFDLTATPSTKEAQAIADELYAGFVSEVRRQTPRLGLTWL